MDTLVGRTCRRVHLMRKRAPEAVSLKGHCYGDSVLLVKIAEILRKEPFLVRATSKLEKESTEMEKTYCQVIY